MENKSLGWSFKHHPLEDHLEDLKAFEKLSFVHPSTHGTIKQQKPLAVATE